MNLATINRVYFVGIGGIGMSALARFFVAKGKSVAGYDKSKTQLTSLLEDEGIAIHYNDDVSLIPSDYKNNDGTLVVFTPAVPANHSELLYFHQHGFVVKKRAQVLGLISAQFKSVAIAGTHGKTTTTTTTAHLLNASHLGCSAFLGGISKNYNSNLILSNSSQFVVIEADEYDRSFLTLNPYIALITSADADHLDIYNNHQEILVAFEQFIACIQPDGFLIMKHGLPFDLQQFAKVNTHTYDVENEEADFHAKNLTIIDGLYHFDFSANGRVIPGFKLGLPGKINVENAIGALSIAHTLGATDDELRNALKEFKGVVRRFDFHVRNNNVVYMDDYAHHPEELKACITSVRKMFPTKKITGIFQPHLYSRTRDFADDFATSLSLLDKLYLLDIYPAREEPIAGVTSAIVFDNVAIAEKILCNKNNLMEMLQNDDFEVLITMGAGDIDTFVQPITRMLTEKTTAK